MFIKQKYDERLLKEKMIDSEFKELPKYIKMHCSQSVKHYKTKNSYHPDEHAYGLIDIPPKALESKKYIKQLIDPDILGLRKKDWNNSTLVPKNPQAEETQERQLKKIKLGLYDEPKFVVKDKIFQPSIIDSRKEFYGWNVSSSLDRLQLKRDLLKYTQMTQIKNKEIESIFLENYTDPIQIYNIQKECIRQKKVTDRNQKQSLRTQYIHENPTASKQKIDGAVFRLNYEQNLKKKQISQETQFCQPPNYDQILKMKEDQVQQIYYHFRPYKYVQINGDGEDAKPQLKGQWQCCRQDNYYAQGCCLFNYENKSFDLNKNKSLKLQKAYKYTHPGIFQKFRFERTESGEIKETGAWSCCQNDDINSRGCNKELYDQGRWNLVSFVNVAGPSNLRELKEIEPRFKLN